MKKVYDGLVFQFDVQMTEAYDLGWKAGMQD